MPVGYRRLCGIRPEHAAILEAPAGIRRRARQPRRVIADRVEQRAVVVARLREISLPLERGRHAEAIDVAAGLTRPVLVAVEEEQPVGAARLPDRPPQRVAPVALLRHRLRVAVLHVRPAVRVPVRVPLDVVQRAAVLVGAALGHRRDLQAAGPPELGLVALREHLHFGDRVDVHRRSTARCSPCPSSTRRPS